MKPDPMNPVFQALASETRRQILDIVRDDPGCRVVDVCRRFDVSRIAVMKHLRILEEANLVISRKNGRTRELYFNAVPIQMIYERWTDEYSAYWASQLTDIKLKSEESQ